jgi:uncharacterized protein (TIGR04222 family)
MYRSVMPLVLLIATIPSLFAKSFDAERYDVQLKVDKSGMLDVTETVVFRFSGGTFTNVFRKVSTRETDGISDVRAFMDGQPMPLEKGSWYVEIDNGSALEVRWHFEPVSDTTRTFTLQYRVAGAIRKEENEDRLVWAALPPDRKYRIESSDVVLEYPADLPPPAVGVSGRRAAILFEGQRAIARMSSIKKENKVNIRAQFAKDSFASLKPAWSVRKENRRSDFASGFQIAGLAALPVMAALILFVLRLRGSEWSPATGNMPPSVSHPPAESSPAVAARLAESSHGASGLMMELARRGVLRIEEAEKKKFVAHDFRVIRAASMRTNAPHEERFIEVLFPEGETDILMTKAGPRLQSKWSRVSDAIRRELAAAGVLDEERRRRKAQMVTGGVITLLAGLGVAGVGAVIFNSGDAKMAGLLVAAGGALAVVGLVAAVAGGSMSVWTPAGESLAGQWKGFRKYLKDLSKGRAPMPGPEAIERYLPYAAAFGLAPALLKRQQETGRVALPSWFAALHSAGDEGAAFASYIALWTVASSSSSAGVSAGAGVSGGGSSGAS